MKLPSGAYVKILSKHVNLTRDEPDEQGRYCEVPAPLNPGDHHWVTIPCAIWDSEADCKAGKPPVLTVDPQFGHRLILDPGRDVAAEIASVIHTHHASGRRGQILDPARAKEHQVEDVLGLLQHPHIQALEVTP